MVLVNLSTYGSSLNTHQQKIDPSSPPDMICLSSGVNFKLVIIFE